MLSFDLENKSASYLPGQEIIGTVQWTDEQSKTTHLEARLIWYTVGKGTRDVGLIATERIESHGRTNGQATFRFNAPHRPYSFSASLLTLTWAVEVIEFPTRQSQTKKLTISPSGDELQLVNDYTEQAKADAIMKSTNFHPKS